MIRHSKRGESLYADPAKSRLQQITDQNDLLLGSFGVAVALLHLHQAAQADSSFKGPSKSEDLWS